MNQTFFLKKDNKNINKDDILNNLKNNNIFQNMNFIKQQNSNNYSNSNNQYQNMNPIKQGANYNNIIHQDEISEYDENEDDEEEVMSTANEVEAIFLTNLPSKVYALIATF